SGMATANAKYTARRAGPRVRGRLGEAVVTCSTTAASSSRVADLTADSIVAATAVQGTGASG
ncbi:MAG TPA: hypothetical protein VKA51_09615, partial [Rubrobacteraceae bacterium]|nr:hypothetical protein [Rubrobacteraceae bacterium]